MHYKAVAEHLAKRCRAALDGRKTVGEITGDSGIWVGNPAKNRDPNRDQDSYQISIAGFVFKGSSRVPFERWHAIVEVYQDRQVVLHVTKGEIPSYVRDCLLSGQW